MTPTQARRIRVAEAVLAQDIGTMDEVLWGILYRRLARLRKVAGLPAEKRTPEALFGLVEMA